MLARTLAELIQFTDLAEIKTLCVCVCVRVEEDQALDNSAKDGIKWQDHSDELPDF